MIVSAMGTGLVGLKSPPSLFLSLIYIKMFPVVTVYGTRVCAKTKICICLFLNISAVPTHEIIMYVLTRDKIRTSKLIIRRSDTSVGLTSASRLAG